LKSSIENKLVDFIHHLEENIKKRDEICNLVEYYQQEMHKM